MISIKQFSSVLLIFLFIGSSTAQTGKLKKADALYVNLSYSVALASYTDLLGTHMDGPMMKAKLAHCYYQIGKMEQAESFYSQAYVDGTDISSEHLFFYAQTLKQNGKYAESDIWMSKFHSKKQMDTRGVMFVKNPFYLEKIMEEGSHFTIENVSFNSEHSDFGGYNYYKGNNLFFLSSRRISAISRNWTWNGNNFLDLYTRNEKDRISPFSDKVNSNFHEGPLCFNGDESRVYFTRNNLAKGELRKDIAGIQNLKLFMADVDNNGKWGNIQELTINSKEYSIGHPVFSLDGKTLYFVSDMPGGFGGSDIYKAQIKADGNLGTVINLGNKINTEGQEMFPWISKDGQLFFSSDGHIGLGGLDIFVAEINAKDSINAVQHAGPLLNSQRDDFAFILNKDGKNGYFSSNREGGIGEDDIYSFTLLKPFVFGRKLNGVLLDIESSIALVGVIVNLYDTDGNFLATTNTDENGAYSFDIEPGKNYSVDFQADGFIPKSYVLAASENNSGTIVQNVSLIKAPTVGISFLLTDRVSKKPLENVKIRITDKKTGKLVLEQTNTKSGEIVKVLETAKIGDVLSYSIELGKVGYCSKTISYNSTISELGIVNLSEDLEELKIGSDLALMINIKPILFDLNKYDIRKDARVELDKIVKVMNENETLEIELGSHTDCRSSYAYNEKLSDERAKESAAYIKARISKPERIYGKGYGENKLKVNCPCEGDVKSSCSEIEHQKNRRTEFVVMKY